jgi:hypothetical protein
MGKLLQQENGVGFAQIPFRMSRRSHAFLKAFFLFFISSTAVAGGFDRTVDLIRAGFEKSRDFMWLSDSIYADKILYWHCCIESEPGKELDAAARRRIATGTMYFADHIMRDYSQQLARFLATGNTVMALTHEKGTYPDGSMLDQYVEYFFTVDGTKITRIEYWAVERTPTPPQGIEQRNKYGDTLIKAIAAAAKFGYAEIERTNPLSNH